MTELTMLAEELGVNERTLRRAVADGTLRAERQSPRRLRITSAEKRYLRSSWPLLAALRGALRTEHNVRLALLFGSAARGDGLAGSDVDLVVEMRDSSLARVADLSTKLEEILGRGVDVVTLEQAQHTPHLLAEAAAEGRVLADRDDRWDSLHAEAAELASRTRRRDQRQRREALAAVDRMLAG